MTKPKRPTEKRKGREVKPTECRDDQSTAFTRDTFMRDLTKVTKRDDKSSD